MDKFKSTDLGGIPRVLDDDRWARGDAGNQGIYQALNNMLGAFGTNFKVVGCVTTLPFTAANMTEGWIILDGELLKVDAVTDNSLDITADYTFVKVTTYDSSGDKTLQSLATAQTYQKNRGVLSGNGGSLNVLIGDKFKDQFDEWKVFDITGINANFICNSSTFGSGSDINLHQAATATSYFKYRLVGKTVNWAFNLDFHLETHDSVGPVMSLVINNLPWTAKTSQTCSCSLLASSQSISYPRPGSVGA